MRVDVGDNCNDFWHKNLFMSYLFNPLLYKLLVAPPSWLPVWSCSLSSSQVPTPCTQRIHTTKPPHTAQATSPSTPSIFIAAFYVTPMNPSRPVPSATIKFTLSPSRPLSKTTLTTLISTSSRKTNYIILLHAAFFRQELRARATISIPNSPISALGMLPIRKLKRWTNLGCTLV